MSRKLLTISIAAASLMLPACSPGEELAEQIIESQEGVGDVEIDEDSGQVSVESEDGSVSIGGGEVPEGFPIAIPDDAEVQAVIQNGSEATVSLSIDDQFESVKDFYEDWVDDNGEVTNKIETSNPQTISWNIEQGDRTMSITLADTGPAGVQATLYSVGD